MSPLVGIDGFGGTLLSPGDPGYDAARVVFNGMIDRRPSAIARCASTADVVAAVRHARAADLPVSVYGGGHSVTGSAVIDGGLCIDLRGVNQVEVDVMGRTVRAGGGATWGEFDAATQAHGLAVTGGRVPSTGVAGLALGSGSGWLERKHGFTCDNLLGAEVVTADGRVVWASATENPDLFWGLRGGGGNYGIVTSFHLQLHELPPELLAGMLVWPAEMASEVTRYYRDFLATAPDEVGGALAFVTAPPAPFVPEPVRGHPIVAAVVTYAGDPGEGEGVLAPLRSFGPPAVDLVEPMPYVAVQRIIEDAAPEGMRNYWTADFLDGFPDEAIEAFTAVANRPVSPLSQMLVIPGGGAIARVDDDATAFGHRRSPWNTHLLSMWTDPADDAKNIQYTRDLAAVVRPWANGRSYLNYIGDEGPDRVRAAFGPERFARLQALKDVWDPTNFFRHNQNIPPSQ